MLLTDLRNIPNKSFGESTGSVGQTLQFPRGKSLLYKSIASPAPAHQYLPGHELELRRTSYDPGPAHST
ncbi:hypothetical protein HZH66_008712 [Vespula vulgaris]|uniref:Uncharacterized protein n=2 Tax=Vespula TaxID=7451 RepID=A0A834NXZ5_VESPE|nr:hypothetical protein HZH66_008712 [Vespula vulgaris]KAF7420633.1 hypothetical protein H0235_010930 [Vespula pensylvanica]